MKRVTRYLLGLGIISATAVTIWNHTKKDSVESIGIDNLDEIDSEEDEITIELFEMEKEEQ